MSKEDVLNAMNEKRIEAVGAVITIYPDDQESLGGVPEGMPAETKAMWGSVLNVGPEITHLKTGDRVMFRHAPIVASMGGAKVVITGMQNVFLISRV